MIKELDDRIELLYKDVMKHPKGNFKMLFDDFKQDVGDIMYGENEKQPSMYDKMMDLLNACCRAFGTTTMEVMAGGRAELPVLRAVTAFIKLADDSYDNRHMTCKILGRTRQYYYHSIAKFESLMLTDKTFRETYNKLSHDFGRDEETD